MTFSFTRPLAAIAALLTLAACGAPLAAPDVHVAGRDALKGTTKTQGDFNLANRTGQVLVDGRPVGVIDGVLGVRALLKGDGAKIITDRDTGRSSVVIQAREAGSGLATGRLMLQLDGAGDAAKVFSAWLEASRAGKTERKSISVIVPNDAGEEAMRLNLYQAWPTKWVGPALNARTSAHASETLEISWETFELKSR